MDQTNREKLRRWNTRSITGSPPAIAPFYWCEIKAFLQAISNPTQTANLDAVLCGKTHQQPEPQTLLKWNLEEQQRETKACQQITPIK